MPGGVTLVAGGAGGIGAATCRLLAQQGHDVIVADLDERGAAQVAFEVGGRSVPLDVTDPESVNAVVAGLDKQAIRGLVCAVGWDEMHPFHATDEVFTQKVIDINLVGPMRLVRGVLPSMLAAGYGRIVLISSDAGRVGQSLEAVYSGAKAGVIGFTKAVARECAKQGITVNAISPGPTDTPMLSEMIERSGAAEKVGQALARAIPLGRVAQPSDIAPAIAFLCSDEAGYITGQTLSVSGGLTMV